MAKRRLAVSAASGAAVCALLAACSSSTAPAGGNGQAGAGGSVTVMVSAGVSAPGTLGRNALMVVQAVKAAAAAVNRAGGVDGKKITITVFDDMGDPTTAITGLQNAISSGSKPLAWFDSGPSNLAAAVLPILTQNKILSFNVAPTADSWDPAKFPYNFDIGASAVTNAQASCRYAKGHGYTRLAILYSNDAWGNALAPLIKSSCSASGVTVTGMQNFDPNALDMTGPLQSLRSGNPDALAIIAYGAPAGYILKDQIKIGWNLPILGDPATASSDIVTAAPPTGLLGTPEEANLRIEVFQSVVYEPLGKEPAAVSTMIRQLEALGPIPASLELAAPYDGMQLLAAGANRAHSTTDAAAIAQAIVAAGDGGAKTAVFQRYFLSSKSHDSNEPATAVTFAQPSKLVAGQLDAPGA